MRLARLDVLRYGKFTDRSLHFPTAPHDFHVIVGPNEAGKSTLRSAIQDLLFGFPVRTALDFVHAKSELLLGARVEQGDEGLDFLRIKANKNTLRSPDNAVLPDTALDGFLNGASRQFFDKMFGLDHARLVAGGNSILNAQDEVGQVLFQAAAGVAGLGKIRDALEQEADTLWAPNRSAKRAYYAARSAFDEATAQLKSATVRARDWTQADAARRAAEAALDEGRQRLSALQADVARLERSRRVAPLIRELREIESAIAQAGGAPDLPPDAGKQLADAERTMATARERLSVYRDAAAAVRSELEACSIDEDILAVADAVSSLEAMRHRCEAYPAEIARAQGRLAALEQEALSAAAELGWQRSGIEPASTETPLRAGSERVSWLAGLMPALPARRRVAQSLREHDKLAEACHAAEAALRERRADVETLQSRLASLADLRPDAGLRAAHARATSAGDAQAVAERASRREAAAQADLDQALARLHPPVAIAGLRRLALPTENSIAQRAAQRQALAAAVESAAARHQELQAALRLQALQIRQYRSGRAVVTRDDVTHAREARDEAWRGIRDEGPGTPETADAFEAFMRQADELADQRHDRAQEEAELQAMQHRAEQDAERLTVEEGELARRREALVQFDGEWAAACERLGVAGLPIADMPDWLAAAQRTLVADRALEEARQERTTVLASQRELAKALASALGERLSAPAEDASMADEAVPACLAGLLERAGAAIADADRQAVRQEEWQGQLHRAQSRVSAGTQELAAAQSRLQAWRDEWRAALAQCRLAPTMDAGAAEGALALIDLIADRLRQIHQLHADAIDRMQTELGRFVEDVRRASDAAGMAPLPASCARGDEAAYAFARSAALARRLAQARDAQQAAQRLQRQLDEELRQRRAAEDVLREADASLQPLMHRAGAATPEALAGAIAQSDRQRALRERWDTVHARLLQEGEGLGRAELEDEAAACDPDSLPGRLAGLKAEVDAVVEQQSRLAVEVSESRRALESIAGGDTAARAEAQRQEALAAMSDAAERYVKVFTAARLLRWSIDRYREEKQGPMLTRASEIFAGLTRGSFDKLRVDYDATPMTLEGQRPDGTRVGIAGLSDGTRDQLYLALRLAALELHLQQSAALPFVADDLFINYDDERSEAGFRALAALSRQTQVIFLTHHPHVAALAAKVVGPGMTRIDLA